MPRSIARIQTPEAARLIKRLCTHWAHKFAVEFDAHSGVVPFEATTTARLQATDTHLEATLDAADAPTLARYQEVVANHLHRMARAGALDIHWEPEAATP